MTEDAWVPRREAPLRGTGGGGKHCSSQEILTLERVSLAQEAGVGEAERVQGKEPGNISLQASSLSKVLERTCQVSLFRSIIST